MSITRQLNRIEKLIKKNYERNSVELQKELSINLLGAFAVDTPVDTGNATASWIATVGQQGRSVGGIITESGQKKGVFDKSSDAKKTINTARKNVRKVKFGQPIYVSNDASFESADGVNSYYIVKLENGFSPKAPTGFFYKNLVFTKKFAKQSKKRLGL